jgi:glycine cleavage system H protein
MKTPDDRMYAKSHEWVKIQGNKALIGITDYAQHAMGDIVFVNLPEEGDEFNIGDAFSDIESVKAVSEAYCPLKGRITRVNTDLEDSPDDTWLVEAEFQSLDNLMSADEYDALDKE